MVLKSGGHTNEWGKLTIEAVQTQFIKRLIGVNKSTTNIMVHRETGRYPLTMFIKLRTVKFVKHIVSQNKHKLSQMAYEYENSILNSNTQIGQRPDKCYFLSDKEKQISYDELLNNVEILKCTHKRIKDGLGAYYEKIWKDMLVKTNKSLVYRNHKTEFKMESYLTQVTNTSHRRALTKL